MWHIQNYDFGFEFFIAFTNLQIYVVHLNVMLTYFWMRPNGRLPTVEMDYVRMNVCEPSNWTEIQNYDADP